MHKLKVSNCDGHTGFCGKAHAVMAGAIDDEVARRTTPPCLKEGCCNMRQLRTDGTREQFCSRAHARDCGAMMSEWSVIEWEARHAAVEARLRHNDSYGFYEEYDEVPLRLRTMRGKIMAQLGVPRGIAEALMAAFGDVDTAIQQGRASQDPATRVMLNGKIQYKLISAEDT
jgi:hypothetical protein